MQASLTNYFPSRKRGRPQELVTKEAKKLRVEEVVVVDKGQEEAVQVKVQQKAVRRVLSFEDAKGAGGVNKARKGQQGRSGKAAVGQRSITEAFAGKGRSDLKDGEGNGKGEVLQEKNSTPSKATPQKLNPAVLREQLRKCKKLSELRSTLQKMSEGEAKLKELQEATPKPTPQSPQLQKFKSIQLEIPSPPRSPMKTPVKTPDKMAAYQRFRGLASPSAATLTLPYKYNLLLRMFTSLETIVAILHNRKEIITFDKLKDPVQKLSEKTFTLRHLAQIKRISPEAYIFKQEKRFGKGEEAYQLTLQINFGDSGHETMVPSFVAKRKRQFEAGLMALAKRHHQEFLQGLDLAVTFDSNQLTRWHPDFNTDEIPDVESDPLPKPPSVDKCTTAKELLVKANGLLDCNNRVVKALEGDKNELAEKPLPVPASPPVSMAKALKGISQSLLDKIRAKQTAKLLREMTRRPEENEELTRMLRLPDMARILRSIFVQEKRAALAMEAAVAKVLNSYQSSLAYPEVEEHVRLMTRLLPDWLKIHKLSRGEFLKVEKQVDINIVAKRLQEMARNK